MLFRVFLGLSWLCLAVYTAIVVYNHGLNLLPIFFGDIAAITWPGQFNLDFFIFLMLSALWTAWRNNFTIKGFLLATMALLGGAGFLLPYLLYLHVKHNGNLRHVLTSLKSEEV